MKKKLQDIYLTYFTDSAGFMACSLSDPFNNLSKRIHRTKYNSNTMIKKCEINYIYCDCFLEYTIFQDDLIEYICLICKKNCQIFFNTYQFSNHHNNKLILLLREGVYPYKCIDNWEKFNEMPLHEKESHLNIVT